MVTIWSACTGGTPVSTAIRSIPSTSPCSATNSGAGPSVVMMRRCVLIPSSVTTRRSSGRSGRSELLRSIVQIPSRSRFKTSCFVMASWSASIPAAATGCRRDSDAPPVCLSTILPRAFAAPQEGLDALRREHLLLAGEPSLGSEAHHPQVEEWQPPKVVSHRGEPVRPHLHEKEEVVRNDGGRSERQDALDEANGVVEDPGVKVGLDVSGGDDPARRIYYLGLRADGTPTVADVGHAASGYGDVALAQLAGVDVGYRAAPDEEVGRPAAAGRLDEPLVFIVVRDQAIRPGSAPRRRRGARRIRRLRGARGVPASRRARSGAGGRSARPGRRGGRSRTRSPARPRRPHASPRGALRGGGRARLCARRGRGRAAHAPGR